MAASQIEWMRVVTISIALFTLVEYIVYWVRKHNDAVLAPISWLILVIGYCIFKFIVDGLPQYYFASVVWNNVILIQGTLLLLAFLFVFRGLKKNGK